MNKIKKLKTIIKSVVYNILSESPTVGIDQYNSFGKEMAKNILNFIKRNEAEKTTNLQNDILLSFGSNSTYKLWCSLYKLEETNIKLIFCSSFYNIGTVNGLDIFKVKQTRKYDNTFKDSYFTTFIELINLKGNCVLLSDDQTSPTAKGSWIKLFKNKDLQRKKVRPFIYDEKQKEEITNYGDIEEFFGKSNRQGEILVGIAPIK